MVGKQTNHNGIKVELTWDETILPALRQNENLDS